METNTTKIKQEPSSKEKLLKSLKYHFDFRITIFDIAFGAMIIALWEICKIFLEVDLGATRESFEYVWMILIGLIFKPFYGIILSILGDTIHMFFKDGFGMWSWAYFIIPIIIYCVTYSLKSIFTRQNKKAWWVTIGISMSFSILFAFILFIVRDHFTYSSHKRIIFDFGSTTMKAIIWSTWSIMTIIQIGLIAWYLISKKQSLKWIISAYSLVVLIVVVLIWGWGPIAMRIWQKTYGMPVVSYDDALYLRIFKTPVIVPIYTLLVGSIYKTYSIVKVSQSNSRWV